MTPSAGRCSVALGAGLLLAACGKGQATAQAEPIKYERPQGWSTECIGRFTVDVPGTVNFGEVPGEFGIAPHGRVNMQYSDGRTNSLFTGAASVAGSRLLETSSFSSKDTFRSVWGQANAYYKIKVIRDGGPDAEEDARSKATQKHQLPNNAYIWRHKNQFDFGILNDSDMRARMLHGKLSGEGSLAQAIAVIDTLWPRYRPRKPGEVPAEAGICTPYGFLADPAKVAERDYAMDFAFRDSRHSNLLLNITLRTRGDQNADATGFLAEPKATRVEDLVTPWDADDKRAAEDKASCRPQQGTASRDLFGCTFAGMKNIKRHREVEYLTLANGQRARMLVVEYHTGLSGSSSYKVSVETVGSDRSATEPRVVIFALGMSSTTDDPAMTGKEPPPLEEAIKIVRTLATSLRLRPGAIADGAVVKDTLEGVR